MQTLKPPILGHSLIGSHDGNESGDPFFAANPATGENLEPGFYSATSDDVNESARLAAEAFRSFGRSSGKVRGTLLRKIAENIEAVAHEIIPRAQRETALPQARLQSETARTCGQLRLFAEVAEEGSWTQVRIDLADPERKPLPKLDIRSMLRPLGPVVVFGASNFPLAFSVAGGDTASALAAGNPVIVKAHPAHPGTSELVGRAIQQSVLECGLPEGVFSLLFDAGTQVGTQLVIHPLIKAGGFTGSGHAGRILMNMAAARPEPIPFFAEMGSTNPVFILPGALRERGDEIAAGLHSSFTLGGGQFCTKPGMVFVGPGPESRSFAKKLQDLVAASPSFPLLTKGIGSAYNSAIQERDGKVDLLGKGSHEQSMAGFAANATIFTTDAETFLRSDLSEEIFGPTTLVVNHSNRDQVLAIAEALEGHLTATIHGTEQDLHDFADLVFILQDKVGRLIFNGFPTGVEVTHAMVHGGPYPATSDGRSTSVGSQAIFRFARPVCYQGFPDSALPDELKNANPLGLWRMIDGKMSRSPLR